MLFRLEFVIGLFKFFDTFLIWYHCFSVNNIKHHLHWVLLMMNTSYTRFTLGITVTIFCFSIDPVTSQTSNDSKKLFNDLFSSYSLKVRPVVNQQQPLRLDVSYLLSGVIEVNESRRKWLPRVAWDWCGLTNTWNGPLPTITTRQTYLFHRYKKIQILYHWCWHWGACLFIS